MASNPVVSDQMSSNTKLARNTTNRITRTTSQLQRGYSSFSSGTGIRTHPKITRRVLYLRRSNRMPSDVFGETKRAHMPSKRSYHSSPHQNKNIHTQRPGKLHTRIHTSRPSQRPARTSLRGAIPNNRTQVRFPLHR